MRITPLRIQTEKQARQLMSSLQVSRQGVNILAPKSIFFALKIEGISSWEANIIKQHLLSLGADAALNRDVLIKKIKTDILIFGSISQLRKLSDKLKLQPFSLKEISTEICSFIDRFAKDEFSFRSRGKILSIKQPVICGIINLTADSFSGDGMLDRRVDSIVKKAAAMVKQGAKIIDLGGESTRPFSKPVKEKQEIKRVIPVLKAIRKKFGKLLISIDTYKYKVARAAVEEGVDIINDITAFRHSPKTAHLVKKHKLGCILMHMQGVPRNMQKNPQYKEVTEEIIDFLKQRLQFCRQHGIKDEQIAVDPGIGFGKRVEDNLKIVKELYKFKILGLPVFLGLSRKSFIGKVLRLDVEERLSGSIAAAVISIANGANILRVHDVKETVEAVKIATAIMNS